MSPRAVAPTPATGRARTARVAALALVTGAGAACAGLIGVPAASAGSAGSTAASQPLVVLLGDHVARTSPSVQGRRIESVAARRPLTGVHTVLPVLAAATSPDGRSWLRVRLPGRPNGHEGWITTAHARRTATEWRITVALSHRSVTVTNGARTIRRFRAVVGKASTPTPRGRFFVEEGLALSASAAGAPYALASSARSTVLQEFDGGPGQIALHGTGNLPGAPGTAVSHGCIRLSPRAITWLATHIGPGTPLTITL